MSLPELKPKRSGKVTDINGIRKGFTIDKQVELRQSDNPEKIFVLQEIVFEDGKKEIRIGYYIIGKKPKMRGKWVWGQYCPMIPRQDFEELIELAKREGIL